jgi:hypothetical protein
VAHRRRRLTCAQTRRPKSKIAGSLGASRRRPPDRTRATTPPPRASTTPRGADLPTLHTRLQQLQQQVEQLQRSPDHARIGVGSGSNVALPRNATRAAAASTANAFAPGCRPAADRGVLSARTRHRIEQARVALRCRISARTSQPRRS